jgi:hypothetical protein
MPRTAANWLCASTLTLLLLATSCTCDSVARSHSTIPSPSLRQVKVIQDPINLGTAVDFTVLAYATVTNTGPTTVGGLLGVSPGSAVTGQSSLDFATLPTVNGIASPATAASAKGDIGYAYDEASLRVEGVEGISVVNIGGLTYTPGLYKTTGSLEVSSGDLTLSGQGVYIFQMETTLQMSTYTKMVLTNGARACDVFWRVGSAATFKVGSSVVGTVLAYSAITAETGVQVEGRLFALNEAVTMDSNVIVFPFSATPSPSP